MNIFYLDNNPRICASMHNNRHCVKMILEYSQLLSTAHRVLDGKETVGKSKTGRKQTKWELNDERDDILYKTSHINHPSAIWVRQSNNNYRYLHNLLVELCKEYTFRYGKVHKCESTGLVSALSIFPNNILIGEFTEPTPAMPKEIIIQNDSIASYRNYYVKSKKHLAEWKERPKPTWYVSGILQEIIEL